MSGFNLTSIKLAVGALALLIMATTTAPAQQGEALREAAQNPIADLISVPFQNNTNFDIGHTDNMQNVLNIQPVYPVHLNSDWNLITRPILRWSTSLLSSPDRSFRRLRKSSAPTSVALSSGSATSPQNSSCRQESQ